MFGRAEEREKTETGIVKRVIGKGMNTRGEKYKNRNIKDEQIRRGTFTSIL